MEIFYKILLLIVFPVGLVIAPIALYRILRAKTRTDYVKNLLLFTGTMLLVFVVAKAAGLMSNTQSTDPIVPSAQGVFGNMPTKLV